MSAAKTLMSEGYKELRMARNYSQNETFQLKKKKLDYYESIKTLDII